MTNGNKKCCEQLEFYSFGKKILLKANGMIQDRRVFHYQGKVLVERVSITPPFRFQAIFQDEGCFLYIRGGDSTFYGSQVRSESRTGEAVLLQCGTYFVEWLRKSAPGQVEVLAIHLYPDLLKRLYQNELPQVIRQSISGQAVQRLIPDDTLGKFIENMEFYFQNPALVSDDLLELKIKELILLLIQSKSAGSVIELLSNLFSPRAVSLKEVVATHLYHAMNSEELAALCHMSLSSFKREFKRIFQDSPASYLLQQRLKKAAELLEMTPLGVNEIAYQTGFNDPAYFTRAFKKQYGDTPKMHREKRMA